MKTCPHCTRIYTPMYSTKEKAMATKDMVAREQWISAVCSQECWDEMFTGTV